MKALTVSQMKNVERTSDTLGVSYLQLMENAGVACARKIAHKYSIINKAVVILCGNGNNGGDGFVLAQKLHEKGGNITTILCQGASRTTESREMFSRIDQKQIDILEAESDLAIALFKIKQADYIIDCLFGTGFHGNIDGMSRQLIVRANTSSAVRIAIDIPSGISGNGDTISDVYFQAESTLALGAYKKAHDHSQTKPFCGEIELIDIGIPDEAYTQINLDVIDLTDELVASLLPVRDPESNKGDYGKLLNISGSVGMGGAALMSTKAALRCGVGLVSLAAPRSVVQSGYHQIPEALTIPLQESSCGSIGEKNTTFLEEALPKYSAGLIGCGLGQDEATQKAVCSLVKFCKTRLVLDADGINAICTDINILKETKAEIVLTPHPGEMARLTGLSIPQIQADRVKAAHDFAVEYGQILVLKGHNTLIALPTGEVYLNPTGNAGMAKGGSGDILAGMTAAFAAQKMSLKDAVILAVYLHGLAADLCAGQLTQYAMTATDLISFLPAAFRKLLSGQTATVDKQIL